MTRTVRSLLPVFFLLMFATAVQANIIISPIYDGSITGDAKASSIEATIQAAISAYQSVITNNITVSIYFQEGGGLGQSNTLVYSGPYTDFYNGLTANNSNPGAIAALNANGGNATTNGGINPVTGTNSIELKSANARALGINIPPACFVVSGNCQFPGTGSPVDGIISLNTSITDPGGGSYSLLATTEHEIDEVLGLGSALENVNANSGVENASNDTPFAPNTLVSSPEDLYRWSAVTGGTRTLSVDCAASASAYFSYGPSTGAIQQFNNTCNGADFGDWAGSGTPNVQDAFATPGATPVLAAAELDALSAIGYNVAVPEPSTGALMFGALLTAGWLKRRRKTPA
jgi:hypothetical protein